MHRCSPFLSKPVYTAYKFGSAIYLFYWLVVSVQVFNSWTWPLYLTHLSFGLMVVYFSLSGVNSLRGCSEITLEMSSQPSDRLDKLQWALQVTLADSAYVVSAVYWCFLFNGWLGALNLQIHLANSMFMALDVFLSSNHFHWRNIWCTYTYCVVYFVSTLVWWGLGDHTEGSHEIYPFLDYAEAPVSAVLFSLMVAIFVLPITHVLNMGLKRLSFIAHHKLAHAGYLSRRENSAYSALQLSSLNLSDLA
ncbi:unnamed protein product [Chrysoparadoxa australica]